MSASKESTKVTNMISEDQSARLKRALRQTELLTYAAAGIGITLLAAIIAISLL
jgi:hypothetical protein